MGAKIYNEDFQVGQKFLGLVNGTKLTVVDILEPGVEYPRVMSGIPYVEKVPTKIVCFEDMYGRISKTGFENAKRLMLQRVDDKMAGFEKAYPLVEAARLAIPTDTELLENVRDGFGAAVYQEALSAVLKNHWEKLHWRDMQEDVHFIMCRYVIGDSHGDIQMVEGTGERFVLDCNGNQAVVEFDYDCDEYVYTVNGKGPFAHSSYEFIAGDIWDVLAMEAEKPLDDVLEDAAHRSFESKQSERDEGEKGLFVR